MTTTTPVDEGTETPDTPIVTDDTSVLDVLVPDGVRPFRPWADECLDSCRSVASAVFEPLYEPGVGGSVIPWLAATAPVPNDDFTVWTVELRDGVSFHDGTPFDADSVVAMWGLQSTAQPPVLQIARSGVVTVVAADTRTVVYQLAEPNARFVDELIRTPLGLVFQPAAAAGDLTGFAQRPVGTGPYVVAFDEPGRRTVTVRHDAWWAADALGEPAFDEVHFHSDQDLDGDLARNALVLADGSTAVAALAEAAVPTVAATTSLTGVGVSFVVDRAPLDDEAVRAALAELAAGPDTAALLDGWTTTGFWTLNGLPGPPPPTTTTTADDVDADNEQVPTTPTEVLAAYVADEDRSDGAEPGTPIVLRLLCGTDLDQRTAAAALQAVWGATALVDTRVSLLDDETLRSTPAPELAEGVVARCDDLGRAEGDPVASLRAAFRDLTDDTGAVIDANASGFIAAELLASLAAAQATNPGAARDDLAVTAQRQLATSAPFAMVGFPPVLAGATAQITGISGWLGPDGTAGDGFADGVIRWQNVQPE